MLFRISYVGRASGQAVLVVLSLFVGLQCSGLQSATASANARPNVLLICVDDLRPELGCYGVDYIHSPNIDALASGGYLFNRHYVQAPTCGASRCALLTGRYGGAGNGALFQRAAALEAGREIHPSLPAWFRRHGYTTVSVGKVSHHPGGRGGPDWNDQEHLEMPDSWDRHLLPAGPWQHPRGWMHGLANGEIRIKAGDMDVFQSVPGGDEVYPDGLSTQAALHQAELLAADDSKPFFLAFGILRPHLPFGAPARYLDHYRDVELPPIKHASRPSGKTTWHASGEFMKYNRWGRDPREDLEFAAEVRKHYAACVSYADAQVGKMIDKLEQLNALHNTVVVLWGDHGWHLGEHAIWGKHSLFEESLRSPLIIVPASGEHSAAKIESVVESVDVFPTLCQLCDLDMPTFTQGDSLVPLFDEPKTTGGEAISYFRKDRTIRTATHRLILHADGSVELYDHQRDTGETNNIADESPELVEKLTARLRSRYPAENY